MVKRYPDILEYEKIAGGNSYYDENGNLIVGESTKTKITLVCNATPNTKSDYVITSDGQSVEYGWLILSPVLSKVIPFGTHVNVFRDGALRASGTVKRSDNLQLNAKTWV